MLERAKITQAGTAVIKDVFAALQRPVEIASEQFLQNNATDTIVEQSIVAAVEGPYTAEEARVVDGNDDHRRAQ